MRHEPAPHGDGIPTSTMPLARSICWRPLGDSYHLLAAVLGDRLAHHPTFVTQPALREIEEQRLAINDDVPVAGLLGGTLARSAERGLIYVTVTRLAPLASVEPGEAGRRVFREALARATVHLSACGEVVVGWYRSRPRIGRRLLSGDERIMLEHFAEPWQTTLIFSADGNGSFFHYKPEAERSFAIPFYELLDESTPAGPAGSVLPFFGYERMLRAAYPEISGVELEEALRMESEEELGTVGRRFLAQLRRAWFGEEAAAEPRGAAGIGNRESGNGKRETARRRETGRGTGETGNGKRETRA